jgi:hypothetical protein
MRKPTQAEETLRKYIRSELKKLMEAEDEAPKEKTQDEPKEDNNYEALTNMLVRKLRDSMEEPTTEDLATVLSGVITHFFSSNESKLRMLKAIKSQIIF